MLNLTSTTVIKELLGRHGIVLTKSRGQNFLVNPSVCPRMAELCGADGECGVLEIGPGIGVLTAELSKVAKKVVAIEVDSGLIPVLSETMQGLDNVKIIHADAMKIDLARLIEDEFSGMKVVLCANLPYYITTPIIMKLLEERLPIDSITVMVQKEFAERLCAPVGSRESGAVTVAAAYYAECQRQFSVSQGSFFPPPKVESEVIRLVLHKQPPVTVSEPKDLFRFIKSGFAMRRKTLSNALFSGAGVDKPATAEALSSLGLSESARIEELTLEQMARLTDILFAKDEE